MGADGGIVHIPVKNPSQERYQRAVDLLRPFWQFLTEGGRADWSENASSEWETKNLTIVPPEYLLGYYGTDRVDSFDLADLADLCALADEEPDWRGDICALTFEDFDLDYRTTPEPTRRNSRCAYGGLLSVYPFHRLWREHFEYKDHEQVLEAIGPLATMTLREWAAELDSLLRLDRATYEETWT